MHRLIDYLGACIHARIDMQVGEFRSVFIEPVVELNLPASYKVIKATPVIGLVIEKICARVVASHRLARIAVSPGRNAPKYASCPSS